MALLDGGLARIFGTAFGAVYVDATLIKGVFTDDGGGGFAVASTDIPVKAMVERVSDRARAASGLPDTAVTISVLRAGLAVPVALDDALTLSGQTYRAIRVETDPAGAAWSIVAVPV